MKPSYGFLDTQIKSQWEFNIKSATIFYSAEGGFLSALDDDTYGKSLNLFEIIDPNFWGVNNLQIIVRALNFSEFYGELGYWGFLDNNLALGMWGKFFIFNNGWYVLKNTYRVFPNPNDSTEYGHFNGTQFGIGPFLAITPTDELLFRLQYHFSYHLYSRTSAQLTDFTLPENHFLHEYQFIFNYQPQWNHIWYFYVHLLAGYRHNSKLDNYFGYDSDPHRFNEIFYNELKIQLDYQHYFFVFSQNLGVFFSLEEPQYYGKSIFKGEREYQMSVYGFFPKSIPAMSAGVIDFEIRTHNLFRNYLNFIFSTAVSSLDETHRFLLGDVYYGLETGLVIDFGLPFFREVAMITYSYGVNLRNKEDDHLISIYLSPLEE